MQLRSHNATILRGTALGTVAQAILFPTGLVTAAVLTRQLGAEGYGLFSLAATVVALVEATLCSILHRPSVDLVAASQDPRRASSAVLRLHLWVGLAGGAAVAALGLPLARVLGEPDLGRHLLLFAPQVTLVVLGNAHRAILVGRRSFGEEAGVVASRWLARVVLIALLVELGFSIDGAIAGSIGAALVPLLLARRFDRTAWLGVAAVPVRRLAPALGALFVFASAMRLVDRLDLFLLKGLGASAGEAGLYAAAQNLAVAPLHFALAFGPVLIATIAPLRMQGDVEGMQRVTRLALRVLAGLLPCAAILAVSAPEVVAFAFGPAYAGAAPLLACLIFAGVGLAVVSTVASLLVAAGRTGPILWMTLPLLPAAIAGHLLVIPRLGAPGAAGVTLACAAIGAVAGLGAVRAAYGTGPPVATLARSALLCAGLGWLALAAPASGWLLLAKLAALGGAVPLGFVLLGELDRAERQALRALVAGEPVPATLEA